MMLWLHLYSNVGLFGAICHECLYWFNGTPLSYHMAKKLCSMCVPAYIFLSGYGLGKVYCEKVAGGKPMGNGRRVANLYIRLWTIMAIFVPIGCIFNPAIYPSSVMELIENMCGVSTSYNGAWWFLLPYSILALSSRHFIHRAMSVGAKGDIFHTVLLLAVSICGYLATSAIDDSSDSLCRLLVVVFNTLYLSFMFFVGILFVKHSIIENTITKLSATGHCRLYSFMALGVLAFGRLCLGNSALIHILFTPLILLALAVLFNGKTYRLTSFLGHHSTNMWLVHYFFISYIFCGYIYELQYPVIIFAALVTVSLTVSIIIDKVLQFVWPMVWRKAGNSRK